MMNKERRVIILAMNAVIGQLPMDGYDTAASYAEAALQHAENAGMLEGYTAEQRAWIADYVLWKAEIELEDIFPWIDFEIEGYCYQDEPVVGQ